MQTHQVSTREESLDPENWAEMRALGHQMVDDMLHYLETVRERPVWQPIPGELKKDFHQPLPQQGQGAEAAYRDFCQQVLPHPMGNIHPRFWGWVIGTGEPFGVLAELLAATMNPNMAGADQMAVQVEDQVINWCKAMLNFPADASGILVSGASMANLVGLTIARNTAAQKAGFDLRKTGLHTLPRQMVLYASAEAHSSIQKAAEVLGLGSDALHLIPCDDQYRIRLDALRSALEADRAAGLWPFCVIGAAGTVNTAAFDDLTALADLCQQEDLWFHVDGAFGALVALAPDLAPLVKGMERANSLAFDLHKWMAMPIEIACTLVRSEEDQRQSFSMNPDYLAHAERGLAGGAHWYGDYGIQLTRSFRALKAWLMIKEHGIEKFGRIIQQNVNQARHLKELVQAHPELELLAPVSLNIVCFRYRAPGLTDEALNKLNQELLIRLYESGIAAPSNTSLHGKYALRVANVNHRSRLEDFDLLAETVVRLGRELRAQAL